MFFKLGFVLNCKIRQQFQSLKLPTQIYKVFFLQVILFWVVVDEVAKFAVLLTFVFVIWSVGLWHVWGGGVKMPRV